VTKTQSAGPISCLKHRATRVLHCTIVIRAAVLMFPLSLQTIISNQMRTRRLRRAENRKEWKIENNAVVGYTRDWMKTTRRSIATVKAEDKVRTLVRASLTRNSDAPMYGTRCRGISQFYQHTFTRRSWFSFRRTRRD